MFSYINGEITEKECDKVVVDVGGVGFELFCSDVTLSQCAVGECRRLYVYLQVKEDGMCLYGFSTLQEKAMFMRLISVSGVGCKMAAAVLSGMEAGALAQAGIELYCGCSGSCDDAVNDFVAGRLCYNPDTTCSHHSGEHSCGSHSCSENS